MEAFDFDKDKELFKKIFVGLQRLLGPISPAKSQ